MLKMKRPSQFSSDEGIWSCLIIVYVVYLLSQLRLFLIRGLTFTARVKINKHLQRV